MRLLRLGAVVVLLSVGVASIQSPTNKNLNRNKVLRIKCNHYQRFLLNQFVNKPGFDFWSNPHLISQDTRNIDVMVQPHILEKFKLFLNFRKITYKIIIDNVQEVVEAEMLRQKTTPKIPKGHISFTKYHRYDMINAYLDKLALLYPHLAKVETIGQTFEKRPMKVIIISRGNSTNARHNPIIWIDAGIHSREWIAPAMALYIIHQLLENPANSELTNGLDWHILPVMNPDGYEYSHTTYRLWRKTRSTKESIICPGVDANRNFGFHWMEGSSSSNPCSEVFAGSHPYSEPEVINVKNHVASHPAHHTMFISLHSYGKLIIYPWGYTTQLPTNWKELDDLAREADRAQQAAGGQPYEIGSLANVLYKISGSSLDWAKAEAGINLSLSIELPGGGTKGFDLPASEIQKTVEQFWPAFVTFGKYVQNKVSGPHP